MSAAPKFEDPADLYPGRVPSRPMGYHRFPSLAAAVAYSIERLSVAELSGAAIETDDDRYDAEAIRELYVHPDFPIRHRILSATP